MTQRCFSLLLALCAAMLFSASAWAAAAAEVTLLTGRGTATTAEGVIRNLDKGSSVYSGELINSSSNSFINLKFADGGFILLRPNTRFQIEAFSYKDTKKLVTPAASNAPTPSIAPAPAPVEQATASRAFFRLLKGGFRAVSGLVGRVDHNEYRVSTPVSTIGIRGTDYEVRICDELCASELQLNDQGIVVEARADDAATAAKLIKISGSQRGHLIKVQEAKGSLLGSVILDTIRGETSMTNKTGDTVTVPQDAHYIGTPSGAQKPLPKLPRFMRVDPTPAPDKVCP